MYARGGLRCTTESGSGCKGKTGRWCFFVVVSCWLSLQVLVLARCVCVAICSRITEGFVVIRALARTCEQSAGGGLGRRGSATACNLPSILPKQHESTNWGESFLNSRPDNSWVRSIFHRTTCAGRQPTTLPLPLPHAASLPSLIVGRSCIVKRMLPRIGPSVFRSGGMGRLGLHFYPKHVRSLFFRIFFFYCYHSLRWRWTCPGPPHTRIRHHCYRHPIIIIIISIVIAGAVSGRVVEVFMFSFSCLVCPRLCCL